MESKNKGKPHLMAITVLHFCVLLPCLACICSGGRPLADDETRALHGSGDPSFKAEPKLYLGRRTSDDSPSQHALPARSVSCPILELLLHAPLFLLYIFPISNAWLSGSELIVYYRTQPDLSTILHLAGKLCCSREKICSYQWRVLSFRLLQFHPSDDQEPFCPETRYL